jgi:hypothetical protein
MNFRAWCIRTAGAAAIVTCAPLALATASCEQADGCAAKACRIDAEIVRAKAKGDARQLARLERERGEIVHCSDDGLKQKRKVALEQAQLRIDRSEAELHKAEATGDAKKVKAAQHKLDSARHAFAQLQSSPL